MNLIEVLGILIALLMTTMLFAGAVVFASGLRTPAPTNEVITLSKANTLSLSDVVTESSMATLQSQLVTMSNSLPADKEINLVIYTPGGDVQAGSAFIDTISGVPQKVNTISIYAASMGFHIVEHSSGKRLMLPSATLMSHRAKGSIQGEFNGNINSRLASITEGLELLETGTAHRMGLDLRPYQSLIKDEYWVSSADAVRSNTVDQIVLVRCDKTLSGTHIKSQESMFGSVELVVADCPLITSPLSIKTPSGSPEGLLDAYKYLYASPTDFVVKYIETERYKLYFK